MPLLKLFGNRFSGHSYKVALCLALTGTAYDYEEISLSVPRADRPEHFRKDARFNEVPLLLIDAQPFVQSNAVLLHLSRALNLMQHPGNHSDVVEWLMWEQSRIGLSLPNLRFEMKFKDTNEPAVLAWLKARLIDDLGVLNNQLKTTQSFVAGDNISIADCSIAGYLYWLDDTGLNIDDWPEVAAWLDRLKALDGWQHPDVLLAK